MGDLHHDLDSIQLQQAEALLVRLASELSSDGLMRAVIDQIADKTRRQLKYIAGGWVAEHRQACADALVQVCKHSQGCPQTHPLRSATARVVIIVKASDLATRTTGRSNHPKTATPTGY